MGRLSRLAVCVGLALLALACQVRQPGVIYDSQSEFNRIIVRDEGRSMRTLAFEQNGAVQSAINLHDFDELVISYTRASMVALAVAPAPKRILIVGLGGGSMPTFLRRVYPEAYIDVAELDPAVADVARKFFAFREDSRMKVHIGDGRAFIEKTANRYDIIFLDAYGADNIPYSLATREFLQAVRSRLAPGGVVAANVWGSPINRLYPSMLRTYQAVFDQVHIVCAERSGNRIVLALPYKAQVTVESMTLSARQLKQKDLLAIDLPSIIEHGYESPDATPGGNVLLDADAP